MANFVTAVSKYFCVPVPNIPYWLTAARNRMFLEQLGILLIWKGGRKVPDL